ncbi:hypothetical protein [Streptomyces sp. NPDC057580]|uniref:hypothetical protein n=1 Tax=Streptomyces sp. NPDC057580 TaxID=3346173 RepID=UPI0036CED5CA
MTTSMAATLFTDLAPAQRLERAAAALDAQGFTVEILDEAAAARTRIKELIPDGASVFTGASETHRVSGITEDINAGGRYDALRSRVLAMDRATQMDEIRRLTAGSSAPLANPSGITSALSSSAYLPGAPGSAARSTLRRPPDRQRPPGAETA